MSDFKDKAVKALAAAMPSKALSLTEITSLLETPPKPGLGDYAFPCFKLAKTFKKKPADVALELANQVKLPAGFEGVKAVGPYVNFFVGKGALAESVLVQVLGKADCYGCGPQKKETAVFEVCSPNTNKPLHLGHVRNLALGDAMVRVHRFGGYPTVMTAIINDRGIHICKSMLAYQGWGNGRTPESENIKSDHFVGDYYVKYNEEAAKDSGLEDKARELLRQWEANDKETRALWREMTDWALHGFEKTYAALGVQFDYIDCESDIYEEGYRTVLAAVEKGLFERAENGAILARLEEKYGLPDKVVLRGDGTSTYIVQDLVLDRKRFEKHGFAKLVHVVGSEQNLYFKQLFAVFALLGYPFAGNCHHLSYGMVYLPTGKMKSREGTVVDADNLLAELGEMARAEIRKRAQLNKEEENRRAHVIALAALKFHMLKVDAAKDLYFDPAESISFDGETGPYVQYSYARAKSILRKEAEERAGTATAKKAGKGTTGKADYALLTEQREKELVSLLGRFPETVEKTRESMSLHTLCQYLLETAAAFNSFYHELPVLMAPENVKRARLALVAASAQVLKNGLALLGIDVLEEM